MFYFLLEPIMMYNWLLILAAVIPAVFLMVKVYRSDRIEKESGYLLRKLVGARPLHLLSQTVLSLKSPAGAFIAALRSANANFALQNTCWEIPNP